MVSEAAVVAPAQAQEAFLDNTSVRTALSSTVPGSIAGQNASFVKSFADAYEHINSVAEAIEQTGGDTSALKAKLDELVALHEAHAGRDARLRAYAREYLCTADPTDFAGVIRGARPVPVPDDHAHPARRFSEAVDHARRERTGADAAPQDEDADIVDVTQAAAGGARGHGAVNSKCPLTMKDVLDLEDPAADVKGYVYERSAIVEYVRRHAGNGTNAAAQCPAAGTNHAVRVAELRPAREVIRAKKRAEAARRVGVAGGDEDDEDLLSP